MKHFVLVSVLMALVGNAFSQEIKTDSVIVSKSDKVTVIVNDNRINIDDSPTGLKIKVFSIEENGEVAKNPYYESRYENDVNSKTETKNLTINIPLKPTFISDEEKVSKLKFKSFEPIYPSIYYSYSALLLPNFLSSNFYFTPPQRANSFEWGSYLFQIDVCHNKKKTLGLTTALGITNTYNHFNNCLLGNVTQADDQTTYTYLYRIITYDIPLPDGLENHTEAIIRYEVEDSFLRYWSLRLPINIQLQWRLGYKKMAFSVGPEFEWRFAMKSFMEYDGNKYLVSDDLAYNPFGVNALGVFAFEDFVVFGRVGLTQMFNKRLAWDNYVPVNIGIGFKL